jgi:hypothetical protein
LWVIELAWTDAGRILAEDNRINVNVLLSILKTGTILVNEAQPELC